MLSEKSPEEFLTKLSVYSSYTLFFFDPLNRSLQADFVLEGRNF